MLLARTLNQTASFHSSLPVKCPVVGCLLITYAIILEQERINSQNNSTDAEDDDKNKDRSPRITAKVFRPPRHQVDRSGGYWYAHK